MNENNENMMHDSEVIILHESVIFSVRYSLTFNSLLKLLSFKV